MTIKNKIPLDSFSPSTGLPRLPDKFEEILIENNLDINKIEKIFIMPLCECLDITTSDSPISDKNFILVKTNSQKNNNLFLLEMFDKQLTGNVFLPNFKEKHFSLFDELKNQNNKFVYLSLNTIPQDDTLALFDR